MQDKLYLEAASKRIELDEGELASASGGDAPIKYAFLQACLALGILEPNICTNGQVGRKAN
jgi:hypothetical protein